MRPPTILPASTREELVHRAVTLSTQGVSRRAIARALGISRNTVKAILGTHQRQREQEHCVLAARSARAPRAHKLDAFAPRIAELMARYPDITAQRVFEILSEEDGFDGGYNTVKRYVRKARPRPKPEPSLTTPTYGPGKMGECDWSPYEVPLLDQSVLKLQAFGYVLVASRRKYYAVFDSNDLYALMDGHVQTFDRFDGCAAACKYDSQKPVVSRWEGAQPIYNPRFLAFTTHYEFRPEAVKGNPNAKPRVERAFWEFETSFLNGRSFRDREDFNAQLVHWLDTIVDQRRRHGTTPLERFAQEKPHLVSLPRHPYDTARVVYRICSIDGFVDWEGNRYAVPYDHITDILPVRITQQELFVYGADLSCVARHQLGLRGRGLKLDPNGYHPPARRKSPVDLDQLRVTFEHMGQGGSDYVRLICAMPPRLWGHQARQILLLRERYSTADLDAALAHAALYGAFESKAVERILVARATPRTLDEYVAEDTARRLADTFGESHTQQHDLGEYDRLPVCGASRPRSQDQLPQETNPCPNESPTPPTPTPADNSFGPPTTCSSSDCENT
jgi:transposase